jgi:hypothetical protein
LLQNVIIFLENENTLLRTADLFFPVSHVCLPQLRSRCLSLSYCVSDFLRGASNPLFPTFFLFLSFQLSYRALNRSYFACSATKKEAKERAAEKALPDLVAAKMTEQKKRAKPVDARGAPASFEMLEDEVGGGFLHKEKIQYFTPTPSCELV